MKTSARPSMTETEIRQAFRLLGLETEQMRQEFLKFAEEESAEGKESPLHYPDTDMNTEEQEEANHGELERSSIRDPDIW